MPLPKVHGGHLTDFQTFEKQMEDEKEIEAGVVTVVVITLVVAMAVVTMG